MKGKKGYKKKTVKVVVAKKRIPKAMINKNLVDLGQGFPKKLKITHKYNEGASMSAAGGLSASLFSCNSLWDPNFSGTGHSVMGFNEIKGLYSQYHVIGSHIKVNYIFPSISQPACCVGILMNDNTSVTGSVFTTLNENTNSRHKYMPAGSNNVYTVQASWSAKQYFGKGVMANNSLAGTATSSPTEQTFFQIYAQALDLVTTYTVYAEIEITYIAIWNELKDQAAS